MSNTTIKNISALEILDSRGVPTLSVKVELAGGIKASASVPSGTSSGKNEACELRDKDKKRYGGNGVLKAAANVVNKIFPKLKGKDAADPQKIDRMMIDLDGTTNKSHLGANAILGVSIACVRAAAYAEKIPLFKYLRKAFNLPGEDYYLPRPMFNVLNGGLHAESGMDVQEFMLVFNTEDFSEALCWASGTFAELKRILQMRKLETGVGLEGGFSPKLAHSKEAIETLLEAARQALVPPEKIGIGLDVAASGLYEASKDSRYIFKREKATFTREQLISWYAELAGRYPLVSVEDGLDESDWDGWRLLKAKLGDKLRIVGDDLTVTNPARLKKAIKLKAINSIIIKPNQIGTLSETMETVRLAHEHGISTIVSHRSGDTVDPFIADLAVAINSEFIKSGSVTRGERVAKYNRLLEIERELQK
jgi:enolase